MPTGSSTQTPINPPAPGSFPSLLYDTHFLITHALLYQSVWKCVRVRGIEAMLSVTSTVHSCTTSLLLPPLPRCPHYVAANAIQHTTWGSLPPFPANRGRALNAADTNTGVHTPSASTHVYVWTHEASKGCVLEFHMTIREGWRIPSNWAMKSHDERKPMCKRREVTGNMRCMDVDQARERRQHWWLEQKAKKCKNWYGRGGGWSMDDRLEGCH